MPNLVAKIIKLKAKEFNKKRKLLAPVDSFAWLLEKAGFSGNYTKTFTISDWWYSENFPRAQLHIQVATQDLDFKAALNQATDVTVNGFVYEINKRDIVPPDGKRPWWELYVTKTTDTFDENDLP